MTTIAPKKTAPPHRPSLSSRTGSLPVVIRPVSEKARRKTVLVQLVREMKAGAIGLVPGPGHTLAMSRFRCSIGENDPKRWTGILADARAAARLLGDIIKQLHAKLEMAVADIVAEEDALNKTTEANKAH